MVCSDVTGGKAGRGANGRVNVGVQGVSESVKTSTRVFLRRWFAEKKKESARAFPVRRLHVFNARKKHYICIWVFFGTWFVSTWDASTAASVSQEKDLCQWCMRYRL